MGERIETTTEKRKPRNGGGGKKGRPSNTFGFKGSAKGGTGAGVIGRKKSLKMAGRGRDGGTRGQNGEEGPGKNGRGNRRCGD